MKFRWQKEVEETEKALRTKFLDRQERREAKIVALTNHVGKLKKKKGRSNMENNHKPPRFFNRINKSFTNFGASLGMTDAEYREYIKTGTMPNKEGK